MDINRKLKIFRCALESGRTPFASCFLTKRCDHSCIGCAARVPTDTPEALDTATWFAIIDRLHEYGVRSISFTGGEPLLRTDLESIINHSSQTRNCLTWVFTSIDKLTPDHASVLKSADFVCASPDMHNLEMDFDSSVAALKAIGKVGPTPALTVTLTEANIQKAAEWAVRCTSNEIFFDFSIVQSVGGCFSTVDAPTSPSAESLRKFCGELIKLREKTGRVLPSYKLLKMTPEFHRKSGWKCPANRNPFIAIDHDGRLMPCQEHASSLNILDVPELSNAKWTAEKKSIVSRCRGCSYTAYLQKTFRNPFDLLQESVALLRF